MLYKNNLITNEIYKNKKISLIKTNLKFKTHILEKEKKKFYNFSRIFMVNALVYLKKVIFGQ